MKVLIGCERSGIVREAFAAKGHDVWSVDMVPSELPGQHIISDVVEVAYSNDWDMLIAHPPCQYVSYAGARWWRRKGWADEQQKSLYLFQLLLRAPIERICVENPRGLPSKLIRKPDDVIQPYEFGHNVSKRTYLWLKNLPPLMKELLNPNFEKGWVKNSNGFNRSRTFSGIAAAMANQWGTK